MAKYRFEQIAINSTEKKKPVEEDRFTQVGFPQRLGLRADLIHIFPCPKVENG